MKRTTVLGTWVLILFAAAGLWYGVYWFYRVPPNPVPVDGYAFVSTGAGDGSIPAIDAPAFESVGEADQYLNDDGFGLDVERNGTHRYYPYQILVWHEAVNDTIDNVPVLVSYAPFTDTGTAFERRVGEETLEFAVTGLVWNNNSVLVDVGTGSKWVQALGRAVEGTMSGTQLRPVLARPMRWSDWKRSYPAGRVLSRETSSARDYTRNPYGNYAATPSVPFPLSVLDARLPAKELAYALSVDGAERAYPEAALVRAESVRETVGGVPVEISFDPELGTARAYRLEINGERGEELAITRGFWFLWAAAFPGISLYELP